MIRARRESGPEQALTGERSSNVGGYTAMNTIKHIETKGVSCCLFSATGKRVHRSGTPQVAKVKSRQLSHYSEAFPNQGDKTVCDACQESASSVN
jgi:hypothetical protein